MPTCPKCGNLITLDAISCDSCGTNFGPQKNLKLTDILNAAAENPPKAWKLPYLGLFLLIDAIFISILQIINPIPFLPTSSFALNVMTVIVAFTTLYLIAFVIGMILSLIYSLLKKQTGERYRYIIWIRALVFSSLPAAFVIYVHFMGR
jgi:phosphoglycerol transferase MdoB-like AlkP superfamily enzyme